MPQNVTCKECRCWENPNGDLGECTWAEKHDGYSALRPRTRATDSCLRGEPKETLVETFRTKTPEEITRRLEAELRLRRLTGEDDPESGVLYKGVIFHDPPDEPEVRATIGKLWMSTPAEVVGRWAVLRLTSASGTVPVTLGRTSPETEELFARGKFSELQLKIKRGALVLVDPQGIVRGFYSQKRGLEVG